MKTLANKLLPFPLLLLALFPAGASPADALRGEELLESGRPKEAIPILEEGLRSAAGSTERADFLILLSRCYFALGTEAELQHRPKEEILRFYAQGEEYADRAVHTSPQDYRAWFWRGSTSGKWGQVKGVFAALDRVKYMHDNFKKAAELNPQYSMAWYSLGQIYAQLPGGIISFGNKEYAVSLIRKSIDLMEAEQATGEWNPLFYGYYVELARLLYHRNWSVQKRNRELTEKRKMYARESDVLKKNYHYEGVRAPMNISDREEARSILEETLEDMNSRQDRSDELEPYKKAAEEALSGMF